MDNRKAIYLDDAIDALESKKDKKAKGDIGGFYNKIIQNDIDALMQLPSADPEAAIVKVLKMVEEYKEKTGTDEIIIMPKNGMKAWDENGVEYTMQPTCNNLATDTISRASAIAEITDFKAKYNNLDVEVIDTLKVQPDESKYEYHYDHTDCIWYRPEARNRCPVTCAQYRDGWNDAMNYVFRDGEGYRPYRRDKKYEEGQEK